MAAEVKQGATVYSMIVSKMYCMYVSTCIYVCFHEYMYAHIRVWSHCVTVCAMIVPYVYCIDVYTCIYVCLHVYFL
jgi:hypothetical protein